MVPFSLFILASSVCKSLQCLISALTQEGEGGHLFRLTCSVMLWGGRNTANKYHRHMWGVLAVSWPHQVCPYSCACAFPVYTSQAVGCSSRELSKAGPGLLGLPKSKPLRFRFLRCSTKAQTWLGLHFVPFPSPSSSGDQVLGERTLPAWQCILSPPQSQPLGFLGTPQECHLRCAMCLLWGADL